MNSNTDKAEIIVKLVTVMVELRIIDQQKKGALNLANIINQLQEAIRMLQLQR
jgi:hypothetical protein